MSALFYLNYLLHRVQFLEGNLDVGACNDKKFPG